MHDVFCYRETVFQIWSSSPLKDATERRQLEAGSKLHAEVLSDMHRRKDEFLAMLSHELRNPLSPIQNAVHILRLKHDDDPNPAASPGRLSKRQGWSVDGVGQTTLLEVSRITTGRIQLRQERIRFAGCYRGCRPSRSSVNRPNRQT